MDALFGWVESTAISVWMRESTSVFAFPAILTAHAVGMALAVGVNAALALRLLGVAPGVPAWELQRFVPMMWLGFWMNTASGVLLVLAYPTKALTNPLFYVKLTLIACGMWLFTRMARRTFGAAPADADRGPSIRALGAVSLACWGGAITTGRFLAYTATRLMSTW